MEIAEIGNEIWDKLSHGEKLSPAQEKLVISHIKLGDCKDTQAIVTQLRSNSQHLRNKTSDEMVKVVDNLKSFMLLQANEHLETAIKSEWEGAAINAQANRIDNAEKQQRAAQETLRVSLPPPPAIPQYKFPDPPRIKDLPIKLPNAPIYV